MGAYLGYARTSTKDQRLDLQLDALRAAGVHERYWFTDQLSGARADRPGWQQCLAQLRPGDTLVVWRLDRLARSLQHVLSIAEQLIAEHVHLLVREGLGAHMDPTTSEGKLLLSILGAFTEFERALIRDRVQAGLTAARARGRTGGRRPKLSPAQQAQARAMAAGHMPITAIAQTLHCSRHTVYKALVQETGEAEATTLGQSLRGPAALASAAE